MIISNEKPKIYERLHDAFGVEWEKGICIVWGDVCHSINDVRPDLFAHEEVHVKQQKFLGPEIWWETYINNKEFRLNQEIEAFRTQIKYLKEHHQETTRYIRRYLISSFSVTLSGPMYGNIISYNKAKELLR